MISKAKWVMGKALGRYRLESTTTIGGSDCSDLLAEYLQPRRRFIALVIDCRKPSFLRPSVIAILVITAIDQRVTRSMSKPPVSDRSESTGRVNSRTILRHHARDLIDIETVTSQLASHCSNPRNRTTVNYWNDGRNGSPYWTIFATGSSVRPREHGSGPRLRTVSEPTSS